MGQVKITPESVAALQDAGDDFFASVDYDVLPDQETAKKLTDEAERESPDWGIDDEPNKLDGVKANLRRQIARDFG